jgi:hypothetical protein
MHRRLVLAAMSGAAAGRSRVHRNPAQAVRPVRSVFEGSGSSNRHGSEFVERF